MELAELTRRALAGRAGCEALEREAYVADRCGVDLEAVSQTTMDALEASLAGFGDES